MADEIEFEVRASCSNATDSKQLLTGLLQHDQTGYRIHDYTYTFTNSATAVPLNGVAAADVGYLILWNKEADGSTTTLTVQNGSGGTSYTIPKLKQNDVCVLPLHGNCTPYVTASASTCKVRVFIIEE